MKHIKNFTQLNESTDKIKLVEDINKLKQLHTLLNNSFEESKNIGKKGANPQKEFEGLFNTVKRTRQTLMELNIDIENFSMYFMKLLKSINDIMNIRDIREATEIKGRIYKIFPLAQQDFQNFISKKNNEIKKYTEQ
jgi:seryl-tRNA synthetase